MKIFESSKNSQTVAAFSAGPSPTLCVAECWNLDESGRRDRMRSIGFVARACGSPSCERTWRQKEPRQFPFVGSTPTRAMRIDQTAGLIWSCERSRSPSRNSRSLPPLNSSSSGLLSLFVAHSHGEAKGKQTLAMYDISSAHFHGVPLRRLFVELPDDEKEQPASEKGCGQSESVAWLKKCRYGTVDASTHWQARYAPHLRIQCSVSFASTFPSSIMLTNSFISPSRVSLHFNMVTVCHRYSRHMPRSIAAQCDPIG